MKKSFSPLFAVSPLDGRYYAHTNELSEYFSEFALFRCRIQVEMEYFIALCELPLPQLKKFDRKNFSLLRRMHKNFSVREAEQIKKIETITNHDMKAVEYFLKKKFEENGWNAHREFIHFGLTSQDINNTAVSLLFRDSVRKVYSPFLEKIITALERMAKQWANIPMLARTHGQPASPTRLGKEMLVFAERLRMQQKLFSVIPFSTKFGGATGNFNAHYAAYPSVNWHEFADRFVNEKLGLHRSRHTTQIEHYDNLAAHCDAMKRINTILIDFCRDIWLYISYDYFKQKIKKDEVGSSTMPHKVNPIDFENAEGNLGIANALFEHLSAKLPVSRLQRDLTDSTVLRNLGVPFAHTLLAFKSILKGMTKLMLNRDALKNDLEKNQVVVAEGIQTILRREGYPNPYEALKELTRKSSSVKREDIEKFIDSLKVDSKVKAELKKLSPHNYTGR